MGKRVWTAIEVRSLLRGYFRADKGYVYIDEVPNGTSGHKTRTIDAIAMGVWQGTGYMLNACEIKVSRADFLAEVADMSKAAPFEQVAHAFWLVAPRDIVKVEEIPPTWGWLVVSDSGLKAGKRPVVNKEAKLNYHFLGAVLRKIMERESAKEDQLNQEYTRGYKEGRKEAQAQAERVAKQQAEFDARRDARMAKFKEEFEAVCGVDLSHVYASGVSYGELFNRLTRVPVLEQQLNEYRRAMQYVEATVTVMRDAKEALEKIVAERNISGVQTAPVD